MADKKVSQTKGARKSGKEEVRIATQPEIGSLMHGLLFAYQKVFINLYGNDARELFPYVVEELSNILHAGDEPIIDPTMTNEENVDRCISFISNDEYLKDIKLTKKENGYIFEVGECMFGHSGIHDILKMDGGICPFALYMGTCLTQLNPNESININPSDFDEKGSKTHFDVVRVEEGADDILKGPIHLEKELFPPMAFKTPIDELDMKIIRELRRDGRQSNVELAKILNSSESTVRRRISLLQSRGIIKGYTALLHYDPKGTLTRAFMSIKVDPAHMEKISKELSQMKETCSVYKTIGTHNLVCELIFSSSAELQEFIDKLQYSEGVLDLAYYLASAAPKPCPWYGF
jgi:Lrp/AsnC family transcriptional regulator for asnA, asnC and gidA